MTYLTIHHAVEDFARWKARYDAHSGARQAAGLHEEHLFRGADQPNEVTLLFRLDDVARAKAFAESADLRKRMSEAGVVGVPEIRFLEEG